MNDHGPWIRGNNHAARADHNHQTQLYHYETLFHAFSLLKLSKGDADNAIMLRVLIVEDDPGMNDYIGDILSQKGFEVRSAFNGFSGLDAIRSSPPHVVILDIFMPEKDGLEMLVELRRFASSLPVLVISGKQHLLSGCSMSLAKQLGANDVLAKPFTPKVLIERVVALANREQREAQALAPEPHKVRNRS